MRLPLPHVNQQHILESNAKRKVIRAGRRSGKTVCSAIMAVKAFLAGKRVLYTAPTAEQVDTFWYEIKKAFSEPINANVYAKNETEHIIEKRDTENRIQARTAWAADMIRGSYADLLIMDEYQLCNEDLWAVVGAPMLLDRDGSAVFIYTPPSLRSAGVSKARDPRHAAKMFKAAQADTTGRWQAFSFTSHDNPYISKEALAEIIKDMSKQSYRQEILAEDDEIQLSWLVYKAFNEAVCKVERFQIPDTWPRYSGHDFGSANPAALFYAQAKLPLPLGAPPYMRPNDFVAYWEYLPGAGKSTAEHVEEFKRQIKGLSVVRSAGGSHQEDGERTGFTAHGWPIQEPVITSVKVQLDRVIGLMELNKLFVFKDMVNYLEELMNCLWVPDNEGKPTDKIKDEAKWHLCSAARYILSGFAPETVTGRRIVTRVGMPG